MIINFAIYNQVEVPFKNLINVELVGFDLPRAELEEVNLSGSSFKNPNLSNTSFKNALFNDDTIWPINFNAVKKGAVKEI